MKNGAKGTSLIIVILAGLTIAGYARAVLIQKGVPDVSLRASVVLAVVSIAVIFFVLGIVARCVHLIWRMDYRTIRSRLSLSLFPVLLFWPYIITHRGTGISGSGSTGAPVELIYMTLAALMCIATAMAVLFMLRRQVKEVEEISSGKIIARLSTNIILALLVALIGSWVFDLFLFGQAWRWNLPERYELEGKIRGVRLSPVSLRTGSRIEITGESIAHAGFGIAKETFEAIPYPLTYTIGLSEPSKDCSSILLKHASREWMHQKADADTSSGWVEDSVDLGDYDGDCIDLRWSAEYADSSLLSEMISLCKYYLRLVCAPDFQFDIRHRMAIWITPSVAMRRAPAEINVLLIGIDALRTDHVSAYGYPRKTTPNIDALAGNSLFIENCYSTAPWTLPSFFSMLTSVYPSIHQYGTNFTGIVLPQFGVANIWTIGTISPDYGIKTLAETLANQDYYTAAFINNPFLSMEHEMDRGFDSFNQYGPTSVEGNQQILPWLEQHQDEKFFLFIHIMDPHDYSIRQAAVSKIPRRFGEAGGDDLQTAIDRYDTIVHFCDEQIGRLIAHLRTLHLDRSTLVIITSDHGEELRDHGGAGHGHSLYDELLRVPLIFHLPGKLPAEAVSELVSTVDIAPTILDLLGLPLPSYYQGQSLVSQADRDALSDRTIFAEGIGSGHKKKAALKNDHKLIYTTTSNTFELYNLKDDPKETRNLTDRIPEVELPMKRALQSFIAQSSRGIHVVLKPPPGLEMCEGTLTTDGVFISVMPLDLTNPKIFRTSPDSKEILFRLWSAHEANGIVFKVDPPEAPIRLNLTRKNDQPSVNIYLGSSPEKPLLSPVALDREMLREVSDLLKPEMQKDGLYIWLKEGDRKTKPVEIDTKTKKELETLGYLN